MKSAQTVVPSTFTGLQRIPVYRQPDGITCGPTCLKMVTSFLEYNRGIDARDLGQRMGTNPRTGTTEKEMQRGLQILELSSSHPSAHGKHGLSHLRDVLADNLVLLRVMLPGGHQNPRGYKHWVVVHGFTPTRFSVACPARGADEWTPEFLESVWSARGYDHFCVPSDRTLHPVMFDRERAADRAAWAAPHEMTLSEFLQGARVVPDKSLSKWHHQAIREAAASVCQMASREDGWPVPFSGPPGFVFRGFPRAGSTSDMGVFNSASGEIVGGIAKGLRWIDPGYRGMGLGAELVLAAFSDPDHKYLQPSSYSTGGYASRLSAHRLALERALAAGIAVPERVLRNTITIPAGSFPGAAAPKQMELF